MNVFADDITIEDDMAVLVKYANGATMTYHLTAYSVSRASFSLHRCFRDKSIRDHADLSHGKATE